MTADTTTSADPAAVGATIDESVPFGIWVCDPAGNATYLSRSFLELLQASPGEWKGMAWTKKLRPGTAEPIGPRTEAATRDFQSARGIAVDGIVGPQARGEMAEFMESR